jgi:hypothetical protein
MTPVRRSRKHVVPVQGKFPLVGIFKTGNYPQKGGFSAPGGSQQGEKLPFFYFQTHIIKSPKITKELAYILDDNITAFQPVTSSLLSGAMPPGFTARHFPVPSFFVFTKSTMLFFRDIVNRFWKKTLTTKN